MEKSFSVSFRLQRVTTETAHVSIPLTPELWRANVDRPDTMSVDTEKLVQTAIERARRSTTVWVLEGEPVISAHPLQTPPNP